MSRSLATALGQYFSRGVNTGAMAMSLVTLVSCENILPDYVEEDKLSEVYRLMEKDMERVWKEAKESGEEEMGDYLIGIVEQIRKKRGMGGILDDESLQV